MSALPSRGPADSESEPEPTIGGAKLSSGAFFELEKCSERPLFRPLFIFSFFFFSSTFPLGPALSAFFSPATRVRKTTRVTIFRPFHGLKSHPQEGVVVDKCKKMREYSNKVR
jgi:hypothetical protein